MATFWKPLFWKKRQICPSLSKLPCAPIIACRDFFTLAFALNFCCSNADFSEIFPFVRLGRDIFCVHFSIKKMAIWLERIFCSLVSRRREKMWSFKVVRLRIYFQKIQAKTTMNNSSDEEYCSTGTCKGVKLVVKSIF